MSLTATGNPGYPEFLAQLKASIRQRQYQALRAVNRELVALYWEIGQAIQQKQEELGWGKAVVETLARDLQAEFPGRNGFSAQNLWLMRQFYREYNDLPKLQPLVREISWAKNLVILSRCKDPLQREFYLRATARFGWTKAVLQHQIDNQSYEKYLLNQTNFDQSLPEEVKAQAALAVKDHYTFDFLELAEEHSELQLEQALVANLRQFLTELGGAFAFIGNQYRLEVGGQDYFIDLLLFHRRLRCLVAIELKIGDFQPEHKGKTQRKRAVQEPVRRLLGQAHNVLLFEPQDYLPFVYLMTQAHLIITDSGTVRLVGTDEDKIVIEAERLLDEADAYQAMAHALNPYGDGQAAMRIRSALEG